MLSRYYIFSFYVHWHGHGLGVGASASVLLLRKYRFTKSETHVDNQECCFNTKRNLMSMIFHFSE